jgi:hypothetical protein
MFASDCFLAGLTFTKKGAHTISPNRRQRCPLEAAREGTQNIIVSDEAKAQCVFVNQVFLDDLRESHRIFLRLISATRLNPFKSTFA